MPFTRIYNTMTLAGLRELIANDAHADQFKTRRAYRLSLLIASVESELTPRDLTEAGREREQQRLIQEALRKVRGQKRE